MTGTPLIWLHIGDLHIKQPGAANLCDLHRIVALEASLPAGAIDFVLLPGDNADDGTPDQYRMVRAALDGLRTPVHILPGDHDVAPGDLGAFHDTLGARALPYAETVRDVRCLFLDVVSAGTGGPDFRLGADQLAWAEREVGQAAAAGRTVAIFMHTYPADLREGADRLGALLSQSHVSSVDMGHTHYNELTNDGGTIFMATRSTGQVEEGPPGFSVASIDAGCVSWRFKPLDSAWPFVLITQPTDRRLRTARTEGSGATVRAKVLGDVPIETVHVIADDGPPRAMSLVPGSPALWQATLDGPAARIVVEAYDAAGRTDCDRIEPARNGFVGPDRVADGSDRDRVEVWPDKGIIGGQLGPNRNGRKW